ncbi:MAG: DUF3343 domain-containing protein [Cyanobacteriota bacterium]
MQRNGIIITFESTHLTMKSNKLLKDKYMCEVIPAPRDLSKSGCKIALHISERCNLNEINDILEKENIQILKFIENL